MRLLSSLIATASVLFCSGTSFALFDGEVLVGKRWYKFETTGATGNNAVSQEVNAAVHLDPIPVIPIGFGLGAIMGDLESKDFGDAGVDEAKLVELDLEIKAWIPMVPVVTPYVKVKVPLSAKLAIKGKEAGPTGAEYAEVYKLTGMHLNAGILYPVIPLVKIVLEVGKSTQKRELEERKVASIKETLVDVKKENTNSDNFLVGVQIGF
jgi:hypothetical protein